jgi:hypothetical protein
VMQPERARPSARTVRCKGFISYLPQLRLKPATRKLPADHLLRGGYGSLISVLLRGIELAWP